MATRRLRVTACVVAWSAATPLLAQLQTPPRPPAPVYGGQDIAAVNATIERFGFDFVTVGAPGNRSWLPQERTRQNGSTPNHIDDRGRVDYSYRIMRTEVVQTQYVDFVRAFRPFWLSIQDIPGAIETGGDIANQFTSLGISIFGGFDVNPDFNNSAVTISWRNAARYANWLHHGAPTDPSELSWDTFHTGAYTFTDESFTSGVFGNPITRNEGARFWLPSIDELLKAAYYDPDRYGEGEEGYWRFPHSSNEEPIIGPPGVGDFGAPDIDGNGRISLWETLAVGQHPETQSAWGVLDVLGTSREWIETPDGVFVLDGQLLPGVDRVVVGVGLAEIDVWSDSSSTFSTWAFRIATVVPAPPSLGLLAVSTLFLGIRRR